MEMHDMFAFEATGVFNTSITKPTTYSWAPQENITTYELAQCIPLLLAGNSGVDAPALYESLPNRCKRHFIVGD